VQRESVNGKSQMRQENTIGPPSKEVQLDNKVTRGLGGRGRIWLGVWLGLVLGYAILEIVDVLQFLRQTFFYPVLFVFFYLSRSFRQSGIGLITVPDMLDVDYAGNVAILVRTVVFAVEIFLIMLPIYLYRKTRRKVYLCWILGIAALVIAALCWFFIVFLSMIGMMD
jgi:hypothetical protein